MKKWLFNPFEMIAGWLSLAIGLGTLLLTALFAFLGNTHLDGVLDLHVGNHITFTESLLEGLIDWLSMTFFVFIAGLLLSRSSIRWIDVLGTQAMARFPFLPATLFSIFLFKEEMIRFIEYKFLKIGEPVEIGPADIFIFGGGTLVTFLMLVWMIILMYKAYSVSCNIKGAKGIITFSACLIFAEIISKLFLSFLPSEI